MYIEVVVGADGGCGSMLEHSMADGPPAMHLTILALQYWYSSTRGSKERVLVDFSQYEP